MSGEVAGTSRVRGIVGAVRVRRAVIAATLVTFGAADVSRAQEPGVVYDPSTPAGQEYAVPLDEARRSGGGDEMSEQERAGSAGRRVDSPAPLFGEGVGPDRVRSSDRSRSQPSASDESRRRSQADGDRPDARGEGDMASGSSGQGSRSSAEPARGGADGSSSTRVAIAGAGGTVAAGALLALLLRRRSRRGV